VILVIFASNFFESAILNLINFKCYFTSSRNPPRHPAAWPRDPGLRSAM